MADLQIKEFGLRNPFIIASSPATQGVAAVVKSSGALPGAVVMRNFGHGAGGGSWVYPSGRAMAAGQPVLQMHAEGTLIKDYFGTLEEYCEGVARARRQVPSDVKLWASVGHFGDVVNPCVDWENEWQRQAVELERAGADALEMHFNTPGVATARDRVYDFYRLVYKTTKMIKARVKVPIMMKLPVESCDPLRAMEAACYGGADSIGPTARWRGFAFDLDLDKTLPRAGTGYGTSGALPIICFVVAEARANGVAAPMYAGGGVYDWQSAAKLIMSGSQMVQLGSLACCLGPHAVKQTIEGLNRFMDEQGYADIDALCGAAMRIFGMPSDVADKRRKALGRAYKLCEVDKEKCIGCAHCEQACWYQGIECKDGKAEKMKKCIGCGYCFSVCPTGALHVEAGKVIAEASR